MMYGMNHGMIWSGMWLNWIFWLIMIILIIWGVKTLAGKNRDSGGKRPNEDSALEILKKRYARGEIDQEEYKEKREQLME